MNPITKLQDLCTRPRRARCVCRRENILVYYIIVMSLQRKTVEAFQLLEVEQLPAEWIADNWEQNFCESIVLSANPPLLPQCHRSAEFTIGEREDTIKRHRR